MVRRMNSKKAVKAISLGLAIYMAFAPIVVQADEVSDVELSMAEQIEASDENILADTDVLVEEPINLIENEAIEEASAAIVNVDMSNVDDALDDGSENIDWNTSTEELKELYETYQAALVAKEEAQTAKDEVVEKKTAISDKINNLDGGAINNNKEASEAISNSKLDKNRVINEIIANVAELHSKDFTDKYTFDQKVSDSSDMYRFYINVVEDGVAYGCLTYYDSVSKVILRKNFKISSDDIDYDYVPKDEWVKGNTNCKKAVFGNGCNYIAAYVDNISEYIKDGKTFNGSKVSDLMRANVNLNNDIDARNQALVELGEINKVIEKAEEDLQIASDNASNALDAYKVAVALYEKNAALDEEVKNINVENAKFEYVKAEVEAWRMQQVLGLIKNTINNNDVKDDDYENIETVINNIAGNLDVAPETVERMVAQIIIDTDNSEDVVTKAKELTAEDAINTLDTTQEIVEIEDEEVPLDSSNEVVGTNRNFWLPLLIALACVTVTIYIVGKRKSEKELG